MIFAYLSPDQQRMDVRFAYDAHRVAAVKAIPGARFVPVDKGGPLWRLPLDLPTGRALRRALPSVKLDGELMRWGQRQVALEAKLELLVGAADAKLELLPRAHPELASYVRPYQRADIAFMAAQSAVINANAPGLGKTVETIASVYEAGAGDGLHLVIAGVTSMEAVWGDELRRWVPACWIARGTKPQRQAVIDEALAARSAGPVWLVVNPAMIRLDSHGKPPFPELFRVTWDTVIVDEFHQVGLTNPKTLTRQGLVKLKAERRVALSGTPLGGRAINLWGVLNWLHPQVFTGKWRWAELWLDMIDDRYADSGKRIGDSVRADKEAEFNRYHQQFMVRRVKREVLRDLPKKNVINVWCELEGEQLRQYNEMEDECEVWIEDRSLSTTSVLALLTRLRQFACSTCEIDEKGTLLPKAEGCKIDQLHRIMADHGLGPERDGSEQAIIFTQFTRLANVVAASLRAAGLRVRTITGETPPEERTAAVRQFERGGRVDCLVMNTKAGGAALTLNRSDLIVFLDETWNPDDQFQAEERNRSYTADIYYLRTKATIDEQVWGVTRGKQRVNRQVLDQIRQARRS